MTTMSIRRRIPWMPLFALLLAAVLLYLVLRDIDWGETLTIVRTGRLEFIVTGGLTLFFSYLLRSFRWHVLLRREKPVSLTTTFWGTWVGYMGNSFLPARAGEIIRTVLVSRQARINISYVLATALTERLIDAVVLVVIVLATVSTMGTIPDWLLAGVRTMAVLGVLGVITLFVAPVFEQRIRAKIRDLPVSASIRQKIDTLVERFLLGMRALQHPQNATAFLALTALVWSVDVAVTTQIALAFDLHFTVTQTLLLLAALGLSSAAPSTPGYLGIYQFVAVAVLTPLGYTQNQALVFITAFQVISFVMVAVFGAIALLQLNAGKWQLSELTKLADNQP